MKSERPTIFETEGTEEGMRTIGVLLVNVGSAMQRNPNPSMHELRLVVQTLRGVIREIKILMRGR